MGPKMPNHVETKPSSRSLPLSSVLGKLTAPALKRRGFKDIQIIDHWSEIVGPQLANWSIPERLSRMSADGVVLTIRVEGAMALEVQHLAPQILARINQFYGSAVVTRLKIIQAPIMRAPLAARHDDADLPEAVAAADAALTQFPEGRLRRALARLGGRIMRHQAAPATGPIAHSTNHATNRARSGRAASDERAE